jgi:hypothetical protein
MSESGFEYQGRFYPWHVEMGFGKDMMLIDRISGLPLDEFQLAVGDPTQQARAPVMLSLLATSLRHGNPEWSVERLVRTVMNMNLDDEIKLVDADTDDETESVVLPPPPSDGSVRSLSNGSSPSSTPADSSSLETSFAAPM